MVAHAQAAYKTRSLHGLCASEMEESELECYTCVLCKEYLVETPRQAPCGERLCSPCWREQQIRCSEDKKWLRFPQRRIYSQLRTLRLCFCIAATKTWSVRNAEKKLSSIRYSSFIYARIILGKTPAEKKLPTFLQCFPDKALQQELTKLVLRCGNKDCSWKGLLNSYKVLGKLCFVYRCILHAWGALPC